MKRRAYHRIGRTGRAGLSGLALSFCDADERAYLKDINKILNTPIPEMSGYPFAQVIPAGEKAEYPIQRRQQGNRQNQPARHQATSNKPQSRQQNDQGQKHVRFTEHTRTPENKNAEKTGTDVPHFIKNKRGDGYPRSENTQKPFVKNTTDSPNKTEHQSHSPKREEEHVSKIHSTGTSATKHKSEAWRNDAPAPRRYEKKTSDSHFKRDETKKHNTAHPRGNSDQHKPDHNKSTTPAAGTPKSEKLSWYKRLGFGKKKKSDGGKS